MKAVTGASGRLGRAIATELVEADQADDVILITRSPEAVADLAERGYTVRAGDFADPASMSQALEGIDTVLMISATGPAKDRIPLHRKAIEAIGKSDVTRIVYTSRVAPRASSPYPFAAIHEDSEARLADLGVACTLLRNNEYVENIEHWLREACSTGKLRFGAKGPIAFVGRRDVVSAAVVTLVRPEYAGKAFELSGPEACDRHDLAKILSEVVGRPIEADHGTRDDYAEALRSLGRPEFIIEMGKGLYDASEQMEWAAIAPPEVEELIGRPLLSTSDYIFQTFAGYDPSGELTS